MFLLKCRRVNESSAAYKSCVLWLAQVEGEFIKYIVIVNNIRGCILFDTFCVRAPTSPLGRLLFFIPVSSPKNSVDLIKEINEGNCVFPGFSPSWFLIKRIPEVCQIRCRSLVCLSSCMCRITAWYAANLKMMLSYCLFCLTKRSKTQRNKIYCHVWQRKESNFRKCFALLIRKEP